MPTPICADAAALGWMSILVTIGVHVNYSHLARPLLQSCRNRQFVTHRPQVIELPACLSRQARCRRRHAFLTYVSTLLVVLCIVSDLLLHRRPCFHDSRLFWGLVDNATHSTVSLLAWTIASHVSMFPHRMVPEALCAVAAGSLLDADHFLAAHAISLRAATSLDARPWGHSVTFIIVVAAVAWMVLPAKFNQRGAALLFVCLTSHQLRDAFRRGLWFAPFGSTPALPYWLYLVLEVLVPVGVGSWLLRWSLRRCTPLNSTSSIAPEALDHGNSTTFIV
ncbi:hypothetical protein H257_07963 [Aphanomyces astaci]|uniref:Transmembrane protein 267 n=1 Tax=Aphanomyces astaci TaxID=112090 RepID=W4GFG8_APHAT|nr:hypothetical protein H257_07963 [Aphanomyces astaci]ETV78415.1 hypothetical protein H257_07963 [Aphanomyces astaci]|eukprot:XP_009831997.1 hypothetical protein H257_07963 [Aphanomyces astaci]